MIQLKSLLSYIGISERTICSQQEFDLVVLGSFSSEVYDYIFGDNPKYYPYWVGVWEVRKLGENKYQKYISCILKNISRKYNIFLCFGAIDINFVFARKYENVYRDYQLFLKEIFYGVASLISLLLHEVFCQNKIYVSLNYVPVDETNDF